MSAPTRRPAGQPTYHHPQWCDLDTCDYAGYPCGDVQHATAPVVVRTDDDGTVAVNVQRDDEHLATGDRLPHTPGVNLRVDNLSNEETMLAWFELPALDRLIAVLHDHREQLVVALQAEAVR